MIGDRPGPVSFLKASGFQKTAAAAEGSGGGGYLILPEHFDPSILYIADAILDVILSDLNSSI